MKIEITTEEFKNAVTKLITVVDKKSSRPILGYIKIKASNDLLELSATDLEISARLVIPANVEKECSFCVNAKNLSDILKELPDTKVILSISPDETTLNLECENIDYSLLIFKSDDFPHLVFENSQKSFELKGTELLQIINKTSHAIALDETRLFLNGIFIQLVNEKLRAVATDGRHLALYEVPLETSTPTLVTGVIVPRKGVYELKKLVESDLNASIEINLDESFIYFNKDKKYFLAVRLIAREYPKYQASIPNKMLYSLIVDKDKLTDAVRRIKIMSNEKSNGIKLSLDSEQAEIIANHPSLGHAKEMIPVQYNGKKMDIGFNAKLLLDTLSVFNQGEISLEINNELSPVILKSENDPNYLGLVMPLKL